MREFLARSVQFGSDRVLSLSLLPDLEAIRQACLPKYIGSFSLLAGWRCFGIPTVRDRTNNSRTCMYLHKSPQGRMSRCLARVTVFGPCCCCWALSCHVREKVRTSGQSGLAWLLGGSSRGWWSRHACWPGLGERSSSDEIASFLGGGRRRCAGFGMFREAACALVHAGQNPKIECCSTY